MRTRQRHHLLLSALLALLALPLVAAPAAAEHSDKERLLEDTAYTLQPGEWKVGIWKLQYGVQGVEALNGLTLSTYTFPWFVSAIATAASDKVILLPNLHAKYEWKLNDAWSVAPSIGYTRVELGQFSEGQEGNAIGIVPLEITGSWRFSDAWTFSSGLLYSKIFGSGSLSGDLFGGAAALSNLQWISNVEWRLSDFTALTLSMRVLAFQDVEASANSTITSEDGYTTYEVHANASTDVLDFKDATSLVPGVVWAWDVFALRLGASLRSWNVPLVNIVTPVPFFPEFDLYWRF